MCRAAWCYVMSALSALKPCHAAHSRSRKLICADAPDIPFPIQWVWMDAMLPQGLSAVRCDAYGPRILRFRMLSDSECSIPASRRVRETKRFSPHSSSPARINQTPPEILPCGAWAKWQYSRGRLVISGRAEWQYVCSSPAGILPFGAWAVAILGV